MEAEKPPISSNPGEGMPTSQVNYGYHPHTGAVPAYNATGHYPATTTVVTIVEDNAMITDHILWSIFSTLYMNCCCLGFVALVHSVKSRDRKFLGDKVGAKRYSDTARSLNIATTTLTLLWFILMIILFATGVWTVNYVNTRT
ncbi:dispanin subfamily A member 2b-like [Rana temporaria]|uniref:dispanin subfamily A member 2b-like n=1 Tax=Rana temporaria TaxID=8407 RepID=UPI001AAD1326|nr:dispanin subfamily A member 2b-like [Rana temporaria]